MPRTYDSIATRTAVGGETALEFSGIPNTFTDLVFKFYIRSVGGGTQTILVRTNDVSSSIYSATWAEGQPSSVSRTSRNSSQTGIATIQCSDSVWCIGEAETNNYVGSLQKVFFTRHHLENTTYRIAVGRTTDGAVINKVSFILPSSTFTAGSRITLYGIARA